MSAASKVGKRVPNEADNDSREQPELIPEVIKITIPAGGRRTES